MVKTYILEDLECAHCAGKIEAAVEKLEGVSNSNCTLLTQKLSVDVDEAHADGLTDQVKKIVKKVDGDITVVEK